MHARKTRQRKKEQMKTLEQQVEALKARQIELKRLIEEKNTANILVDLFTKRDGEGSSCLDPKVDELLKRDTEDIPDSSKIPELPALILPGNPSMRKVSKNHAVVDYPDDGIDYELLAKDRATCSQTELDMIRRERNRMHAKRTRDRKRIFIEKMEVILRQLESENKLLEDHLESILDSTSSSSSTPRGEGTSCDVSPALGSSQPPATNVVPTMELLGKVCETDIATFLSREKRKAHSSLPTPVALEDMDCTTSSSSVSTDNCDESAMGRSLGFPNQFEHENKRRCIAS
jgi:hypothetical protein